MKDHHRTHNIASGTINEAITTTTTESSGRPARRRVSFSQYTIWATCPQQWKLSYHDKLKPEDNSIHLIFGTAIHEAIQGYLDTLYNGPKFKSKIFDIEAVFKDKLLDLFKAGIKTDADGKKTFICDQDTLREFYVDGCEILAHIRKFKDSFFPTSGYELVGCEIPLQIQLNGHIQFIGYVDIIVRHKKSGDIFIYDLKTSKKGWYYEKKDPKKLNQLLLYKRFYSQQFGVDEKNIVVAFIILKRKINENSEWASGRNRISQFEPAHGSVSVKKAVASFHEFVNTTFGSDGSVLVDNLKPTPSEKNCKFCPYRENGLCEDSHYLTQISKRR